MTLRRKRNEISAAIQLDENKLEQARTDLALSQRPSACSPGPTGRRHSSLRGPLPPVQALGRDEELTPSRRQATGVFMRAGATRFGTSADLRLLVPARDQDDKRFASTDEVNAAGLPLTFEARPHGGRKFSERRRQLPRARCAIRWGYGSRDAKPIGADEARGAPGPRAHPL